MHVFLTGVRSGGEDGDGDSGYVMVMAVINLVY